MKKIVFPFVVLPREFISLLKANLSTTPSAETVFSYIRLNKALYHIIDTAFKEFDDGRGPEKVLMALGWSNFRERVSSLYVYKLIYGDFPLRTNIQLVDDVKKFESRFRDHSVNSYSRVYLLGFYLKLANMELQSKDERQFVEIRIPEAIDHFLKLSQGRSEKIDWLILILYHLHAGLGDKVLTDCLMSGQKFEDIYPLMTKESQDMMAANLLAYGASIDEPDIFLYDKI
jgi:hypothetical protein